MLMFYCQFVNCNVTSGLVDAFLYNTGLYLAFYFKNCFDTNCFVFTLENDVKLKFVFFLPYTNFWREGDRVKV